MLAVRAMPRGTAGRSAHTLAGRPAGIPAMARVHADHLPWGSPGIQGAAPFFPDRWAAAPARPGARGAGGTAADPLV